MLLKRFQPLEPFWVQKIEHTRLKFERLQWVPDSASNSQRMWPPFGSKFFRTRVHFYSNDLATPPTRNDACVSVSSTPWCLLIYYSRRTAAEPAATTRQSPKRHPSQSDGHGEEDRSPATGDRESEKRRLSPPPIGPMVAVFLDASSVDKLKAHFPEARDGQLRKVVIQYGPSASERQMYRHLFGGAAEVTVRKGYLSELRRIQLSGAIPCCRSYYFSSENTLGGKYGIPCSIACCCTMLQVWLDDQEFDARLYNTCKLYRLGWTLDM